jgi:ribosome-associated protein
VTGGGELLITARRFRTQEANRADARRRLAEMIAAAHIVRAKRKPTRVSKAAKARRVEQKRQRSTVKQARGKVDFD